MVCFYKLNISLFDSIIYEPQKSTYLIFCDSSLPHTPKNKVYKNGCLNRTSIKHIVMAAQLRNLGEVVRLMLLRVVRS